MELTNVLELQELDTEASWDALPSSMTSQVTC